MLLFLLLLLLLLLDPLSALPCSIDYAHLVLDVFLQLRDAVVLQLPAILRASCEQGRVLIHQTGKVLVVAVLWTQEIELRIVHLLLRQTRDEGSSVLRCELGSELDHLQILGADGRHAGRELKLSRWLGAGALANSRAIGKYGTTADLRFEAFL